MINFGLKPSRYNYIFITFIHNRHLNSASSTGATQRRSQLWPNKTTLSWERNAWEKVLASEQIDKGRQLYLLRYYMYVAPFPMSLVANCWTLALHCEYNHGLLGGCWFNHTQNKCSTMIKTRIVEKHDQIYSNLSSQTFFLLCHCIQWCTGVVQNKSGHPITLTFPHND